MLNIRYTTTTPVNVFYLLCSDGLTSISERVTSTYCTVLLNGFSHPRKLFLISKSSTHSKISIPCSKYLFLEMSNGIKYWQSYILLSHIAPIAPDSPRMVKSYSIEIDSINIMLEISRKIKSLD